MFYYSKGRGFLEDTFKINLGSYTYLTNVVNQIHFHIEHNFEISTGLSVKNKQALNNVKREKWTSIMESYGSNLYVYRNIRLSLNFMQPRRLECFYD